MSNKMLDVLCVGRACCVCVVGRVVSLGVRRSAAFRLAWCVWACFVFVVGCVVSLGVQRSVWRGVCGACLLLVVLFR